jgi:hypothetical protein
MARGDTTKQILDAVAEYGPMTTREICDLLGLDLLRSGSLVSRLAVARKSVPKRLYVERWILDAEGQKLYPRAVYALGDKPCAKRPKPDRVAVQRRYRHKLYAKYKSNSVFNLRHTLKDVVQILRKSNVANDLADRTQVETP